MKLMWKLAVYIAVCFLLLIVVVSGWIYFYAADLPDVAALRAFAPRSSSVTERSRCGTTIPIPVIAASELNGNVRAALLAENGRAEHGVLKGYYLALVRPEEPRGGVYSLQLARPMFCSPRRQLSRALAEVRTAVQIERRFDADEVLTIYANQIHTGADVDGIEAAALYYLHKHARDLDVSEAALLVSLVRAPSQLSPIKHPDRALTRRNEIIDGMQKNGFISNEEAEKAKTSPLNVVVAGA